LREGSRIKGPDEKVASCGSRVSYLDIFL
jgi:hypothetical protein